MSVNPDLLKEELQGNGFLSRIKEERMPSSEEMSELALEQCEESVADLSSNLTHIYISKILERLLELEQEIYLEKERETYRFALVYFIEEYYQSGQSTIGSFDGNETVEFVSEYPALFELFRELESAYNSEDGFVTFFSDILPQLYPVFDTISTSAMQSRRKRAGDSLESHLMTLFDRLGYDVDLNRQGNGSTVTLKSPDGIETSFIFASQTTLADRFRQSLIDSQSDPNLDRYLATASGKQLITDKDRSDITKAKIEEIRNAGYKLVVFEDVAKRFDEYETVISYEKFVNKELKL